MINTKNKPNKKGDSFGKKRASAMSASGGTTASSIGGRHKNAASERNRTSKPNRTHMSIDEAIEAALSLTPRTAVRNSRLGAQSNNDAAEATFRGGRDERAKKEKKSSQNRRKKKKEAVSTATAVDESDRDKEKSRGAVRGGGQPKKTAAGDTSAVITDTEKKSPEKGHNKKSGGRERSRGKNGGKVKIISLGGLGEIGKNITLFESGDDIVIIDAGLAFPDEDMPGVDLVIPDFGYIINNAHKVRGVLITHGHEDHIGGIPYLLSSIDVPIYGTRLSLGIIEGKLDEHKPPFNPRLYTVEAGDVLNLGVFRAEFVHVNHSIADACAIFLKTPGGNIFHSGDFKLDVSPIDGRMMDLTRIGEIGKEGVDLLLCESTNAERAGYTPSERTVGDSLDRIFMQNESNRLIIATFSSNVHRVQQIINTSAKYGRRVAVLGRSMVNIIGAAAELGYMDIPDGTLVDINEIKRFRPEELTLITTGSQGEPMSALYRIAFSEHDKVRLSANDTVVLSSSAIPGNEKLVGKIINALVKNQVKVVSDSVEGVHVSGHACKEEIKLLIALTKPRFYMPIHGEARHLYANGGIAEFMGIPRANIFISEIGKVLELGGGRMTAAGTVQSGKVLVDGSGVGDIGSVVLRDRKHLSEDGLVVVVATVDITEGLLISGPDIVSRGFVYVKESGDLMAGARDVCLRSIEHILEKKVRDFAEIKTHIRDDVAKFIFKETKRKPMIIPIIMDI